MTRRHDQSGIALVITLFMLSVITVLAVTFLAVSRRDRVSVTQKITQTTAHLMADTGLERAKGQILGAMWFQGIQATNSVYPVNFVPLGPDLFVSRNATTNASGSLLYGNPDDGTNDVNDLITIANLKEDPRAPVFIDTNRLGGPVGQPDFRFSLDLNRNGIFESNGLWTVVNESGQFINGELAEFTGDPEWIAVPEDPNIRHSSTNRFIGRYCYIVLPAGRTLDLNFINNQAKRRVLPGQSGFHRNQGVGGWEINLAALLIDLNTNAWGLNPVDVGYDYSQDPLFPNDGRAFRDALDLLNFRGRRIMDNRQYFPPGKVADLADNLIDDFSDSGVVPPGVSSMDDDLPLDPNLLWPGAFPQRSFVSLHECFDPSRLANYGNFITNLTYASGTNSTYDRYSFYRFIAQVGTESVAELEGTEDSLINLNYVNLTNQFVTNGLLASLPTTPYASNLVSWQDIGITNLFRTVADRLLRAEFGNVGLTSIPIYTNGSSIVTDTNYAPDKLGQPLYGPRVHQLLQIAANLCDATRGSVTGERAPYFPAVFRPVLAFDPPGLPPGVYITDFVEVENFRFGDYHWFDVDDDVERANAPGSGGIPLPYGQPLIIGARKGFPNFNQVGLQSEARVARRLLFRKMQPDQLPVDTNQNVIISMTNSMAVELWNSYTNAFPRQLEMTMTNTMVSQFYVNQRPLAGRTNSFLAQKTYGANAWPAQGFEVPVATNLPLSVPVTITSLGTTTNTALFERVNLVSTNVWSLSVSNRMVLYLTDQDRIGNLRLVDYVSFKALTNHVNISERLQGKSGGSWDTTPVGGVAAGILAQIAISLDPSSTLWRSSITDPATGQPVENSAAGLAAYLITNSTVTNLVRQAGFAASDAVGQATSYEVNDPLVHYTQMDIMSQAPAPLDGPVIDSLTNAFNFGQVNAAFQPWGGQGANVGGQLTATKDPIDTSRIDFNRPSQLYMRSDFWDFPTNPLPNIGWIGRVHRGTPWQTIYLKAAAASAAQWLQPNGPGVTMDTHPTNDWRLLDHFTTAIHPNATRGRLSINQTNYAAWSALFSGVSVSTAIENNGLGEVVDAVIEPMARDAKTLTIIEGIKRFRDTLKPPQQFHRISELLAVPELTDASPFLNAPQIPQAVHDQKGAELNVLRDADYERLPQQILSLLKVGEPRFVIYAYGQSLRPADNSIERSGALRGLCRNYRITGEVASRAVVRVEPQRDPVTGLPDWNRPPRAIVEQFSFLPPE